MEIGLKLFHYSSDDSLFRTTCLFCFARYKYNAVYVNQRLKAEENIVDKFVNRAKIK